MATKLVPFTGMPTAADFSTPKKSQDLNCDLDGFNLYTNELFEVLFFGLSFIKTMMQVPFASQKYKDFIEYMYVWFIGQTSWVAYMFGTIYFLALDFGFGSYVCDALGYTYYPIEALQLFISFGDYKTNKYLMELVAAVKHDIWKKSASTVAAEAASSS